MELENNINENKWDKFILICKPEQSGKTFIMIQEIIKQLSNNENNIKNIINIIFCDNSLLLTKQTGNRIQENLSEYKSISDNNSNDDTSDDDSSNDEVMSTFNIENSKEEYIEFSSKSKKYKCIDSVLGVITYRKIKNILCCTNGTRTDDIYDLIETINENNSDKFYFKIWIDEADKYISQIDRVFKPLVDEYNNVNVYCITATAKKLFDKYNYMNVFPLENTTSSNYHGWEDNDFKIYDMTCSIIEFVNHILINVVKNDIKPGTKWFIPAGFKKTSHHEIKDICLKIGFAVIIVNGDGIQLILPNREVNTYSKKDILNNTLDEIYIKHDLKEYPVAITGNLCIARGISIMSEKKVDKEEKTIKNGFMIDYAILSSTNNAQETSQLSGRVKGNIKNWINYKRPFVYTTTKFDKIAKEWEIKSRELARLAYDKELNGKKTIITKSEYKTLGEDYQYIVHEELFTSYKKALEFLKRKDIKKKKKKKVNGEKRKEKIKYEKNSPIHRRLKEPLPNNKNNQPKNGYALTSKLVTKQKPLETMTQDDRITYDKAINPNSEGYIAPGRCISSTPNGSRYLILPIYETMETPAKNEKYQVRYISFKKN